MLELAKESPRDHLLLTLMRWGLRCGEIVGWRGLPGLRWEDVRAGSLWIKGKGFRKGSAEPFSHYDPNQYAVPMPLEVMEELRRYGDTFKHSAVDKVFSISEVWAEQLVKRYARLAGIEDWQRVGPHRLRAFFATDAKDREVDGFMIRDLMRHKHISTTNIYIGRSTPERMGRVVDRLAKHRPPIHGILSSA